MIQIKYSKLKRKTNSIKRSKKERKEILNANIFISHFMPKDYVTLVIKDKTEEENPRNF